MNATCRTCLCFLNESNRKCSLSDGCALVSDSSRFELMKNVMNSCSLTLFQNEKEELSEVFVCTSCVEDINNMLNFLEKCIRSEAILKQANEIKSEVGDKNITSFHPKVEVEIKVEEDPCGNIDESPGLDLDDIPLSLYNAVSKNNDNHEEPKYECPECHKTFPSALSLTIHKYKRVGTKPYTCAICNETFQTIKLIKKHIAVEHDSAKCQSYLYKQGSEIFVTKHHISCHDQRKHNTKTYSCTVCKRTFASVASLKFHENVHSNKEPFSGTFCSKSLPTSSQFADHKKKVHSETKKFQCHCGRSFNRKKKLEFHMDSVHEKKERLRKYHCPECDKKFLHPYALKNHINTHLGVKPFLCNACGAAFTALSNLTSHFRRVHSGEKSPSNKMYLCHNCGESFARASHLKRHTLRKHVPNAEKKYECPVCKKRFLEKSDVTGHVKLHDDLKPFVCDQCSKCFRTSWRLQAHVNRVHLGLRPFECPTCLVKFKTKSHLEKHIRTHTGEKPFPCPHCAYTCAEKSNLKKHINIHLKTM